MEKDTMNEEKRKNTIIILLVIIIIMLATLLVLLLTGKINYKGNTNNNEPINNVVDNNQNDISVLPKWANYLLEQNITNITYEKGNLEHNDTTNKDECTPSKTMTKEQLRDVLTKMTDSQLKKFDAGGFGGPCWGGIIVKYNNQEFRIYMSKLIIADDNDKNIISLLEKEKYTLNDHRYNQEPRWTYEYDWDTSYIDTLF